MTDDLGLNGVRVVVTDADTRLGLYVIRALGRAGCRVTALSLMPPGRGSIGLASRFVAESHHMEGASYRDNLVRVIETLSATHDVVVPVSTLSIETIAENAGALRSKIRFCVPDLKVFRKANDKSVATGVAERIGIPVPKTYRGLDPETIGEWACDTAIRFPLVVKFGDDRRDTLWNPADRYKIVESVGELAREYKRMHAIGDYPLVQEFIRGPGYGYFSLVDASGRPTVSFCHRRLREYPITGGPSTLCESVHDPRLIELGSRLLTTLKLVGVAMVEFKLDLRTDEYKFLEINPRFWGSLPLAIRCGVNFPAYLVQMALGRKAATSPDYRVGVKLRFLFTDILAVRQLWLQRKDFSVLRAYAAELLDLSVKDGLIEIDDLAPVGAYVWSRLLA